VGGQRVMQSCKLPAWEFANQRTVLSVLKNNAVKKGWEPHGTVGVLKGTTWMG